ncbi:SMP-30/gluconolactonase/LRE family protein [soil metagenome]
MYKLFTIACCCIFLQDNHYKTTGSIERIDPALDAIISKDAVIEIIAAGFKWSEGPLWLDKQNMLLFSDIPANIIYKWTEAKGKEIYLIPSGYTSNVQRSGETGSNGLLLNKNGKLVMCQHGNRQMAMMDAAIDNPKPVFLTIAGSYVGKKLNSPNDAAYRRNGDLFFTDPPYGLEKNMDDPLKELPYQGVYKVTQAGVVKLLTDSITRPNGIAFLPGQKTLLVGNSDGDKPFIYAYDLAANDSLINPRIFCNGGALPIADKGGFDGIKVDKHGNVFASGPGGICIFNKDGKMLGLIRIPGRTSNCAFADDEETLYITADMYLMRVKMR